MENEIKKLIEKHTSTFLDMCDIYGTASVFASNERMVIDDLQSILKLERKKYSENKKGILSTLDDVAKYNYSKSEIKQAYNEGYIAGQKDLEVQKIIDSQGLRIPKWY